MKSQTQMNFLWYAMAAVIAAVATASDIYAVSGAVSKPMLWSLFGVAVSQIVTQKNMKTARKKAVRPSQDVPRDLPPSNVSTISKKKGISNAYKSAKPKS